MEQRIALPGAIRTRAERAIKQSAMREQLKNTAASVARRRTEEKRAEAFFPLRATTTAADS
jgi:hypothetical protein